MTFDAGVFRFGSDPWPSPPANRGAQQRRRVGVE